MAAWSIGPVMSLVTDAYGLDYPRSVVADLPLFTQSLMPKLPVIATLSKVATFLASLGAFGAMRYAKTSDSGHHGVTLIAVFLYHLVLMAWFAFIVGFFLLPKLKAGI